MNIPLYVKKFEVKDRDKTKLEIWYNKQKKIIDLPFLPYFYDKNSLNIGEAIKEKVRITLLSSLSEVEAYKYSFPSVNYIPLHRTSTSFEHDIPYIQRVAIDTPYFYEQYNQKDDLDIMYFDIETDSTGVFPKANINPITTISYMINDSSPVTYSINSLEEGDDNVLMSFLKDMRKIDPDVLVGYNCNFFDLPYIINRLRFNRRSTTLLTRGKGEAYFINDKNEMIINIKGRCIFDVFDEVLKDQTLYGITSRKMKDIAKWFNVEKTINSSHQYKDYEIITEDLGIIRSIIGTKRLERYCESDVLITK